MTGQDPDNLSSDLLAPDELCERYDAHVTIAALERWRHQKSGPPYVRVGGLVFYRIGDVLAWEAGHRIDPTADGTQMAAGDTDLGSSAGFSPHFMSPEQLSARYGGRVSVGTIERWRWQKTGPTYYRLGGAVLYRLEDVLAWEARCRIRTDGRAPRRMQRRGAQDAA